MAKRNRIINGLKLERMEPIENVLELESSYICIKSIVSDDGEIEFFTKGEIYHPMDGFALKDNKGRYHGVSGDKFFKAHFEKFMEPAKLTTEGYKESKNKKSILETAQEVVNGDRATDYGDMKTSFDNIAKGWSVIAGTEITAQQVGLMMIWLKICRENNRHKVDNLVDLVGYTLCLEKITEQQ